MHLLITQKINKKTKKIMEEKTQEFRSIYNAERQAFQKREYNLMNLGGEFKVVCKIRKAGER